MAGRLAAAFIHSKLTPLVILASLLLGVYAVVALPREEEPQIIVPMVDVFVELPGATPAEVEQRVTRPLEKVLWEVPGLEYLYSTSSQGRAMIIARFLVGENEEAALVRLNQKLAANAMLLPPGASAPLVQARSIDDVPVMALTLWGARYDDVQLRAMAAQLQESLKEIPDISEITLIGGRPRQVSIELDPAALSARGLDPLAVYGAIAQGNQTSGPSAIVGGNQSIRVDAGSAPASAEALRQLVVGQSGGAVVHLGDVATVVDGGAEPISYVQQHPRHGESYPAVTLSIAKRKGTNAIALTRAVEQVSSEKWAPFTLLLPDSKVPLDAFYRAMGVDGGWTHDRAHHPHEANLLRLDTSRANATLGWRPLLDFDEALAWTAAWYGAYARGDDVRRTTFEQVDSYLGQRVRLDAPHAGVVDRPTQEPRHERKRA